MSELWLQRLSLNRPLDRTATELDVFAPGFGHAADTRFHQEYEGSTGGCQERADNGHKGRLMPVVTPTKTGHNAR